MFSRLTRSFKGSQDTLGGSTRAPVSTLQDLLGEYQDVRSQTCQSEAGGLGQQGRERKRRSRKLSRLFGSDTEEERRMRGDERERTRRLDVDRKGGGLPQGEERASSVVSDNPHLYSRSISMATLTPGKSGLLQGKEKQLDRVQSRMESIQKSLSVQGLSEGGEGETVVRLRRELQRREKAIALLKKQIEGQNRGREEVKLKIEEIEEKVLRRERYLKEMREEAFRRAGSSDNATIEGQITAAEREYEVERVQLELLDLGQELLKLRCQAENRGQSRSASLASLVGEGEPAVLLASKLSGAQLDSLDVRCDGGLEAPEGRLLEVCGQEVSLISAPAWQTLRPSLTVPAPAVFLRRGGGGSTELRQDIALIQSRLEAKLEQGRGVETELGMVRREREGLAGENTRLRHRVAFLEEHTRELQAGLKGVRDSLARTLDSGLASTLAQLEGLGETDRCSTATSGVYSQGESEGSASPPGPGTRESSSAAGREVVEESRLLQEAGGARGDSRMLQEVGGGARREHPGGSTSSRDPRRWSLGLPEVPPPQPRSNHNRRRTIQPGPPPKPARQYLNQSVVNLSERSGSEVESQNNPLARSSSRVSSMMRWPNRGKDRSASSLAVDRMGSRDLLV